MNKLTFHSESTCFSGYSERSLAWLLDQISKDDGQKAIPLFDQYGKLTTIVSLPKIVYIERAEH